MNSLKKLLAMSVLVGIASIGEAQIRRDVIVKKGSPLREVLAVWGEPNEKVERSVKHELVWLYNDGASVTFKDGRVSSFRSGSGEQLMQAKKAAEAEQKVAAASNESRDMLRDLVREIPSGGEGQVSSEPAPPSNDPELAGLIPNAIPHRDAPAGIAPGSVVMSPDEEE